MPLDKNSPIKLSMTAAHGMGGAFLQRIGILFGTHGRSKPGDAGLKLKSPNSDEFVQIFSVTQLADNKYTYFDLDSKRYTSGKVFFVSGSGISTWESHNEKSGVNTCIVYEYSNGKRRFTPGCPLF